MPAVFDGMFICMHGVQKPWQACSFQHNSIPSCQGGKFVFFCTVVIFQLKQGGMAGSQSGHRCILLIWNAKRRCRGSMDVSILFIRMQKIDAVATWMLASCLCGCKNGCNSNMDVSILLIRGAKMDALETWMLASCFSRCRKRMQWQYGC